MAMVQATSMGFSPFHPNHASTTAISTVRESVYSTESSRSPSFAKRSAQDAGLSPRVKEEWPDMDTHVVIKSEPQDDISIDFADIRVSPSEMDDILSKVVLHVKHETSRDRRREAIERRNRRRNIVPKTSLDHKAWLELKRRKSRIAAASYREKQWTKLKLIKQEISLLLTQYPSLQCPSWIPSHAPVLTCRPDESREDFRKRKNRESAALSRRHQLEQLQFFTYQLERLRQLTSVYKPSK
ncbi:hypothetical protein LEN26_010795 [Aphanomyces euteiches]|nr:hypothetical protein LEN26_010795 [Aphanomyces euteiches]KAH9123438.1 hypothetical protein AeMF1_005567 [Aphanomyces euteiches]KAH9181492.1 hypothetical protein AeNC1_016532 [Aphanomyces euteiches]